MGGRYSRNKGRRGEYALRNMLRDFGWEANRVPLSGSAQGFKGDVVATKKGDSLNFEVKVRKQSFDRLYSTFGALLLANGPIAVSLDTTTVVMLGLTPPSKELRIKCVDVADKRALQKLKTVRKWIQGSDWLVLKDDGKPFLFVRYVDHAAFMPET